MMGFHDVGNSAFTLLYVDLQQGGDGAFMILPILMFFWSLVLAANIFTHYNISACRLKLIKFKKGTTTTIANIDEYTSK